MATAVGDGGAIAASIPAAVSCTGLSRSFAGQAALEGFSFSLSPPEVVALVGVNGAGKSTFIKLLLDLGAADSGQVLLGGLPVSNPASRAGVAFLPERFLPPHYLTGGECLHFLCALQGVSPEPTRVAEVLTALDLDPDRLPLAVGKLSKGTAQKLGLAAVALSGRALWVLDEPLSGLDPIARAGFFRLLAGHRAGGGSVLYSTHVLSDVARLADRMVLLHRGQALYAGTPQGLQVSTGCSDLEGAYLACIHAARAVDSASSR